MSSKRKKLKPFWERAYKGHAYWLGKQKLGKVTQPVHLEVFVTPT